MTTPTDRELIDAIQRFESAELHEIDFVEAELHALLNAQCQPITNQCVMD